MKQDCPGRESLSQKRTQYIPQPERQPFKKQTALNYLKETYSSSFAQNESTVVLKASAGGTGSRLANQINASIGFLPHGNL